LAVVGCVTTGVVGEGSVPLQPKPTKTNDNSTVILESFIPKLHPSDFLMENIDMIFLINDNSFVINARLLIKFVAGFSCNE
jgi:hypothetical protein